MTPPRHELPPVRVTGTPASAARSITKIVKRGNAVEPVREARQEPVLRRPEPAAPVMRTPKAPADSGGVIEMTLAGLAKLVDQRKRGVQEVVLDDPTDRDDLDESDAPLVLSRGSQASLAARMLRRR